MEEQKWIETKKECEVNEYGNLVVKKVKYEGEKPKVEKKQRLERKDIIDLTLRFVGADNRYTCVTFLFSTKG